MNEESLFAGALEKAPGAERQHFLEETCGADGPLRRRIEDLLAAAEGEPGMLDNISAAVEWTSGQASRGSASAPSLPLGSLIAGRYRLLELIGEGGMGEVFVAEQIEPVRRKVALKLIKPGLDSRAVLARFEKERQALAIMDHPHIAKVLDGGVTDSGRPYFVMEYLKGSPITEYCDQVRMPIRQRLELFATACQAVQHAHQKGIIHRDLKPSNILVALYDDKPVVKVIDFGLAKVINQPLADQTHNTGHAVLVGTPLYMSPEQAQLNNLDIDTRSDVYALGVILYELLTGTTPIERLDFRKAAFDEGLRLIREVDPPTPSTRLSSSQTLASVAAQRQIEPARLSRLVRGELDWIVMKSLEKDRNRRYESASALERDVFNYLQGDQVAASPPSRWYRFRKFASRNKGPVFAGSLVLLTLVGGIIGTSYGLLRSERYRKRAEEREQMAIDAVKRFGDVVSESAELKNTPALNELREKLLKEPVAFFTKLRESMVVEGDRGRPAQRQLGNAIYQLAVLMREIGSYERALELLQESAELYKRTANLDPNDVRSRSDVAHILMDKAIILRDQGKLTEAQSHFDEATRAMEEVARQDPITPLYRIRLSNCLEGSAVLSVRTGKFNTAITHYEASKSIREQLVNESPDMPDHKWRLATSYSNIGASWNSLGKQTEALAAHSQAIAILDPLSRGNPKSDRYEQRLASAYANVSNTYLKQGKTDLAIESSYRSAKILDQLQIKKPHSPELLRDLISCHNNIGVFESERGRYLEAVVVLRRAVGLSKTYLQQHPTDVRIRFELGRGLAACGYALRALNKLDEAEAACNESQSVLLELDKFGSNWEHQLALSDSSRILGEVDPKRETGLYLNWPPGRRAASEPSHGARVSRCATPPAWVPFD